MKKLLKGKGLKIKAEGINNLYHPTGKHKPESLDFVYVKDSLQEEKFAPIALKEWLFLLKDQGYFIIEYLPTQEINPDSLEKMFWWLFRKSYEIVDHQKLKKRYKLIVRKTRRLLKSDDDINKWTFGMITNGLRKDWIERIIASIREQKIPQYEIIICGTYFERKEKDFKYVPFSQRDERGWITRKKNIICKNARYENLCIIHDRIVFEKGWFLGMKKYGNCFEVLGCVQKTEEGLRAGDWLTLRGPLGTMYKTRQLDYQDWDWWTYLPGQLTIVKKSVWEENPWDETRYWNEQEDIELSFRLRDQGFITRFNPYSSCLALDWRHGRLPKKGYQKRSLIPKDMLVRRSIWCLAAFLSKIKVMRRFTSGIWKVVNKSKIYNWIINH